MRRDWRLLVAIGALWVGYTLSIQGFEELMFWKVEEAVKSGDLRATFYCISNCAPEPEGIAAKNWIGLLMVVFSTMRLAFCFLVPKK